MNKLAIVILTYNGRNETNACLESLASIDKSGFSLKTYIVDNGSKEKFDLSYATKKPQDVEVVRNEQNLGYTGGNNVGIKKALVEGADLVMLLNNDTLVDKNFALELLITMYTDSSIGIVSPKIYFAKGYEFHKDRYKPSDLGKIIWYVGGEIDWENVLGKHIGVDAVDKGQFDQVKEIEYATGCCMLIKRDVFEKIGLLDEKYFLYYEDNDFSMRARKAGFSIYFTPKSVVWHKNASSSGGSGSVLQDYYITRNRMLFGMRYAPLRAKIALIKESIQLLISGRPWQKKGIRDYYLQRFGCGRFLS